MTTISPIGVFDSGVGGLSIMDEIHELMPNENLIYLADSAYAPYGQKALELIQRRCHQSMKFFMEHDVKAVVLACNTATAVAVALLRDKYTLPIIGMEPAIKPASLLSKSGVVGVLATAGTIDSDKFSTLKSEYSADVEIITKACPGLVELIEQPHPDLLEISIMLGEFTADFIDRDVDTLVLGCSHYSLIKDLIAQVVGPGVEIVDTGLAVAKEVQRRLQENGMENTEGTANIEFFTSGDIYEQEALFARYWKFPVKMKALGS